MSKIIYTYTDEAPALATESLLPIIEAFAGAAGVEVETRDISLAGRILAAFPDRLDDDQRVDDALAELGELAKTPEANIIKLPNISASIPQLKARDPRAAGGRRTPSPTTPRTRRPTRSARSRTATTRSRAAPSTRCCARATPTAAHPPPSRSTRASTRTSMGEWSSDSRAHVATMAGGDFRSTERSVTVDAPTDVRIELVTGGRRAVTVLKASTPLLAGEIIDAAVMSRAALCRVPRRSRSPTPASRACCSRCTSRPR